MADIEKAKEYFYENKYTVVLCKDNKIFSSYDRGVSPLLNFYELGISFEGFSAADKVIGSGAAFMYVILKVKSVFTPLISKNALKVLKDNNIEIKYEELVDKIKNRKGDGFCPIETAIGNENNLDKVLTIIKDTLKKG